jgi:hypothetical protein
MSLLAGAKDQTQPDRVTGSLDRILRICISTCAFVFGIAIMRTRLGPSEIVYLLIPIAASSLALASAGTTPFGSAFRSRLLAVSLACATAALPLIVLLVPYFAQGHLAEFVNGTIILPQKRLTFASSPLPPVGQLTSGVLMILWMLPLPPKLTARETQVLNVARWALAAGLAAAAFWSVLAHQFVFGSVRAVAALLPTITVWLLLSRRVKDDQKRRLLFVSSSMLAWASLIQFPFGWPTYFCYVMPLAVVAAVAAVDAMNWVRRPGVLPWVALLLVFALFSNRGYAGSIGIENAPYQPHVSLNLERAHLNVRQDHATAYRRIVSLIDAHLQTGTLLAGPDCPEMYFLTGRLNPSGVVFDFFSESARTFDDVNRWATANIIVINGQPAFSPVVQDSVLSELRDAFPQAEQVGPFEVRWR